MVFWDIGSSEPVQQFFTSYLKGTKALVFVVDASDKDMIGTARMILWQVMEDIQSIPLIIIGNKIDEEDVMSKEEIVEKLGLNFRADWEV